MERRRRADREETERRWRGDIGGRCTNSRIGPTWDNHKLRDFYRSLSRSTGLNENDLN